MKSKILSVLVATTLLLACIPAGALSVSAATYGDLTYTLSNGEVTITDCDESVTGEMNIPATIEGYPVTTIGDNAFENCCALTSVIIPDSVLYIYDYAFSGCTYLTEIIIGNRVKYIYSTAFNDCNLLTDVHYRGNERERIFILNESGNSYGTALLANAKWYYYSGITGDCTWRLEGTHLIISGNGTMKHYTGGFNNTAPWGDQITSVTIEDGVTMIGANAFHYCYSLTSVDFGKDVEYIGTQAFRNCIGLTEVVLPDSVNYISNWAFQDTTALTSVTLGKGPIDIKRGAFWYTYVREPLNVYYNGTRADREANLTIDENNNGLTNGTWNYADDPISDEVTHSVMDTVGGNGLAFQFGLTAKGVVKDNKNVVDLTNATINYLGKECKLIGMGAVMTNNAEVGATAFTLEDVNGDTVLNIPTVYLQEVDEDSCAFAARVINIPENQLERTIYARAYYVVEVDGEEITVYGDVDSASCAEYL